MIIMERPPKTKTRVVLRFQLLKWRWVDVLQEYREVGIQDGGFYGVPHYDWVDVKILTPLEKALM